MKTCSSAVKMVIVICQGHASFATDESGVSLRVNEHLNNEDRLKKKNVKSYKQQKLVRKQTSYCIIQFFLFLGNSKVRSLCNAKMSQNIYWEHIKK